MTTFRYISISKVDWRSANTLLIIFVTLLIITLKNCQNFFLRVINFEKRQIAEKGRKRPKKKLRPNADLDKLKRPIWSETTKYGNTVSVVNQVNMVGNREKRDDHIGINSFWIWRLRTNTCFLITQSLAFAKNRKSVYFQKFFFRD